MSHRCGTFHLVQILTSFFCLLIQVESEMNRSHRQNFHQKHIAQKHLDHAIEVLVQESNSKQ